MERTHDGKRNGEERALVRLFRTDAPDQTLRLQDIAVPTSEGDLLWVDLCNGGDALLREIARRLAVPQPMLECLLAAPGEPQVSNYGDAFLVRIRCLPRPSAGAGTALDIAAGPGFAATFHKAPIGFLDELREREQGETRIGVLTAESFAASLLDWYLSDYVDAATECERAVDDLEEAIMHKLEDRQLPELDRLRRQASDLRRMLNLHRRVFAAIGRPDFRPARDERPNPHFASVRRNYEHVAETLEDLRAMVGGSFHLFSTRIGMRTNRIMQALTVATVIFGFLAVVAATMGMNFKVAWFDTGAAGFGATLTGMAVVALGGLGLARWKRWI
jgi:magnesium transporter